MMSFEELGLDPSIKRAIETEGYQSLTAIQQQAIPALMAGKDVLAIAPTGTGKTAAFALPLLHLLHTTPCEIRPRHARALILAPTRELVTQVAQSLKTYGQFTKVRCVTIFGGVGQNPQVQALSKGTDVVIATPGRLLDLINQGFLNLSAIEHLVLDEADRMLDMGFIGDIKKVVQRTPKSRQTLLFSATMSDPIRQLADAFLKTPVQIKVAPVAASAPKIAQLVYMIEKERKADFLFELLRGQRHPFKKAVVFTRSKRNADTVAKNLNKKGLQAEALHGGMSQNARTRAMTKFASANALILVATDIAARGLDIEDVSLVINFNIPEEPESYVHRIGRTGRAGALGTAVSLCGPDERVQLRDIERLTKQSIPVGERL